MSQSNMNNAAQSQPIELSFEWAKSASWDMYEQEVERVLKQALMAPKPGFMDSLTGTLSKGWNAMPTWGKGALIGSGIGAVGGMLTDDRKRTRGLLNGALLGGGLGALGGLAYGQFGNQPPAADKVLPATTTTNPATRIEPPKPVAEDLTDKAMQLGDAAVGGSTLGAVGAMAGGTALKRLGSGKVQVAGTPGYKADFEGRTVLPSRSQIMQQILSNNKGEMGKTMSQVARQVPLKTDPGIDFHPSPDNTDAAIRLMSQKNLGRYSKVPLESGDVSINVSPNQLIKQRIADLNLAAGKKLAPGWTGKPLNTALKGVGTAGQVTGALGLANQIRHGVTGDASLAGRLGAQPETEAGLANILRAAKGFKKEDVMSYLDQFSPEFRQRALSLLR